MNIQISFYRLARINQVYSFPTQGELEIIEKIIEILDRQNETMLK
jgi:hypothetical protein